MDICVALSQGKGGDRHQAQKVQVKSSLKQIKDQAKTCPNMNQ